MDSLPVTAVAALLNGAIFLLLTLRVIRIRLRDHVVLGDGENRELMKAIRGQANAAEQMPIALIVMGLAELGGAPLWGLIPVALLFTAGRAAHGLYFARHGTHWRFRTRGMWATIYAQGALLLLLLLSLVI